MGSTSEITILSAFKRLLKFYKPDLSDIFVIIVYAFVTGLLFLAVPIAANSLVTTIAFGQLIQPLIVLSVIVFLGLCGGSVLRYLQVRLAEIIQQRIFVRVSTQMAIKVPSLDFQFIKRNHIPDLVNRFLEIVTIQKVTTNLLMEGVGVVFKVLMGLLLIAFYHPFFLAYGIVIAFAVVCILFLGAGATKSAVDESTEKYRTLEWLEDIARYPILFKSTFGESLAYNEADKRISDYIFARRYHFSHLQRQIIGSYVIHALGASSILILGGWLVMIEQLTLGQLVAAEIAVSGALYSVARLGKTFESLYDLLASILKLEMMLEAPSEDHSGTLQLPEVGSLSISFKNVSMRSDKPRDNPISLDMPPGTKFCIFGRTASGKSTLADYLLGLKSPALGHVHVGGHDVRDINVRSLRGRVHLVRGKEVLDGTIQHNVACLRSNITTERVIEALQLVGLLEDVQALPDGIRTHMSSLGDPLSSGQIAQLMLARAIAGRPGLLILDETLDGIDATRLKKIYDVLLAPDAPWTLLDLTSDPEVWEGFERHYLLSNAGIELMKPGARFERTPELEREDRGS